MLVFLPAIDGRFQWRSKGTLKFSSDLETDMGPGAPSLRCRCMVPLSTTTRITILFHFLYENSEILYEKSSITILQYFSHIEFHYSHIEVHYSHIEDEMV